MAPAGEIMQDENLGFTSADRKTLVTVEVALDYLKKEMQNVNERLTRLELNRVDRADIKDLLEVIGDKADRQDLPCDRHEEMLNAFGTRLTQLEGHRETSKGDIADLKNDIKGIKETVDGLRGTILMWTGGMFVASVGLSYLLKLIFKV